MSECPVCHDGTLEHDPELNCFHCTGCLYQWHPSMDYDNPKRFITNKNYLKQRDTL